MTMAGASLRRGAFCLGNISKIIMESFRFEALGTKWSIDIDGKVLSKDDQRDILEYVGNFEETFSRFKSGSEVNAFRKATAGVYPVSSEMLELLGQAELLRQLTEGAFNPAVAEILEKAGYDATYRLQEDASVKNVELSHWSLSGGQLVLSGPITFDFGGIGKGYCIDKVAEILKAHGYDHFIVEGGGDMFATSKADGSGFRVAVEWPGQPDMAVGVVELKNKGLAMSDRFRRQWGRWHHIIDTRTKESVAEVAGAVALAPTAWDADCATSGLFLASSERISEVAERLGAEFLIFRSDGLVQQSTRWPGEVFVA